MATNPEEYIPFDNVSPHPYPLYPTPHHHTGFPPPPRGPPFPPPVGPGSYYKGPYQPNTQHHHHPPHHHNPYYEQQYQQHYWTNPYNRGRGGRRGRGNYRGKRKRTYHDPQDNPEGDGWFESVLVDPWKGLVTEDEELVHRQRLSKRLSDIPPVDSNTSTIISSSSLMMFTDPVPNTTESHSIKVAPVQSVTVPLSPEGGSDNICLKEEDLSKGPLIVTPSSPDPQIPSQQEGPPTSGADD